jgi:branched-chain amino acid transport system substrate-binding protein
MTRIALLLVVLSLLLPAGVQTTAPPNSIKIGTFLSLTGSTAAYGVSALNAIKLATDEVNRNDGIDGSKIELVVESECASTRVHAAD